MPILNHDNLEVYYGPPGTGKTTQLLDIVERECERVAPNRIGFVSFTRKAIDEAKGRAISKFNFKDQDLTHFKTLHSTAYRANSLKDYMTMQKSDYVEFGKLIGADVTNNLNPEECQLGQTRDGDHMLFMDGLARARVTDLKDVWGEMYDCPVQPTWPRMQQFSRALRQFKDERNLWDFADMLEKFTMGYVPRLEVLIVDEVQDLSTLQWKMVAELARHAKRVYVAGDDDQGIYSWSGANVKELIGIGGRHVVLDHSYRLPRRIHNFSMQILRRIRERHEKRFSPRDEDGLVRYIRQMTPADFSTGEWLILARNNYQLRDVRDVLINAGYFFSDRKYQPEDDRQLQGCIAYSDLLKGKKLTLDQVKLMYALMGTSTGVAHGYKQCKGMDPHGEYDYQTLKDRWGLMTNDHWRLALRRLPQERKDYFSRMLKNGENLRKPPRIKVSTIHGAKGGEADNVLLFSDVSYRCWKNQEKWPDDEHRTFYVGATRARRSLTVLNPSTEFSYNLNCI